MKFFFNIKFLFLPSGDVSNDRELLKWVKKQFEGDDIEDVNAVVVDKIARGEVGSKELYGDHNDAAVIFCKLINSLSEIIKFKYFRQTRRCCFYKDSESNGKY